MKKCRNLKTVIRLNRYKYLTIIGLLLIISFPPVFTQQIIRVSASGTSITRDVTLKQARELAITEAQKNALIKAGVKEQVYVSSVLLTENVGNNSQNYFNEFSSIETNANILLDSIYNETRNFDEYGNMIISIDIDAIIYRYNKGPNPNFSLKIKGLKDKYYSGQLLSFTITPSESGYLKIFTIENGNGLLLYPYKNKQSSYLSDDFNYLLKAGEEISFPIHQAYKPGYSIDLEIGKDHASNNIIFVFMKSNHPLSLESLSLKDILRWIYNIPTSERYVVIKNILIAKNEE